MSARPAHVQNGWSPAQKSFGAQARQAEQRARKVKAPEPKPSLKLVSGSAAGATRISPRVRLLALVAVAGVFLFGIVAFHVLLSQGQFELQKLNARADAAQADYQKKRLEVAQLESPSRITRVAQERLGMVPAERVTPVTPGAAEMPRTQSGSTSSTSGPTTEDPGAWTAVKPHLNSNSQ